MRIWGVLLLFLKDFFVVKDRIATFDYKKIPITFAQNFNDFRIRVREFEDKPDALECFFPECRKMLEGYIHAFSDTLSFFDYAHINGIQDAPRISDNYFFVRACMILYPERINEIKNFVLEREKICRPHFAKDSSQLAKEAAYFEEQCSLMQEHGIPTLAADRAFYAEDLGVEDLILKGFKLI